MSALGVIARIFGVKIDDADAVMRSEKGYQAALSRRSLLAAAGAMVTGQVWVPSGELVTEPRWDKWDLNLQLLTAIAQHRAISVKFFTAQGWR